MAVASSSRCCKHFSQKTCKQFSVLGLRCSKGSKQISQHVSGRDFGINTPHSHYPEPKTRALGGVATGSIKAIEAPIAPAVIKTIGL